MPTHLTLAPIRSGAGVSAWARYDTEPRKTIPVAETGPALLARTTFCQNLTSPECASREMAATRARWGGGRSVQGYRGLISFDSGDRLTPETALAYSRDLCRECFADREVVGAVHLNTGHLHTHFTVNGPSCLHGRFSFGMPLWRFRREVYLEAGRKLAVSYGLRPPLHLLPGETYPYRLLPWETRHWRDNDLREFLNLDIRRACAQSRDVSGALELLKKRGWHIKTQDKKTYITLPGVPGRWNLDLLYRPEEMEAMCLGDMHRILAREMRQPEFPASGDVTVPAEDAPLAVRFSSYIALHEKIASNLDIPLDPHLFLERRFLAEYREDLAWLSQSGAKTREDVQEKRTALTARIHALAAQIAAFPDALDGAALLEKWKLGEERDALIRKRRTASRILSTHGERAEKAIGRIREFMPAAPEKQPAPHAGDTAVPFSAEAERGNSEKQTEEREGIPSETMGQTPDGRTENTETEAAQDAFSPWAALLDWKAPAAEMDTVRTPECASARLEKQQERGTENPLPALQTERLVRNGHREEENGRSASLEDPGDPLKALREFALWAEAQEGHMDTARSQEDMER